MHDKHLTHIKRLCEAHRSHCLARGWATEEEIAARWPAPKPKWTLKNYSPESYLKRWPDGPHADSAKAILVDDTLDWVRCYGYMFRFTGRKEWLKDGTPHASDELMKALHDEPIEVPLANPVNGTSSVFVYPKSHWVLRWLEVNGWIYNWVFDRALVIRELADDNKLDKDTIPEPMELLENVANELSVRDAILCWVACTEDPFVPWVPGQDPWVPVEAPPKLFFDLSPVDVFQIRQATQLVNLGRLQFLPKLASKKNTNMTFDKYFSTRARRVKQPAKHLMMRVSMASQLVEDSLASASLEEELGDL